MLGVAVKAAPGKCQLSGAVIDAGSGEALVGAVVTVGEDYLWAVTDSGGRFVIDGIQKGSYIVKVSCLGFVDSSQTVEFADDIDDYQVKLKENSLALKEVVVTAERSDGIGTSHTMGRDALNHLQMSSVTDMASLLPGGRTVNPDLTSSHEFSIRSGGTSAGNAAFGTAVEVNGVRLGNNAGFGGMSGVDTRSVSVDNIESVEVISGVPSVEYGDLGSGMVRINTRKGRTPLNVTFSVNPRTYQVSASKGVGLSKGGVINVSAEWAKATKKLTSPYESYARRGMSLLYSKTFGKSLRFEAGLTGNLGGMDSKDDPDAFSGAWARGRDNILRANTAVTWQLNRSWITSLKFDASVNYNDNRTQTHAYVSSASMQPAVHSEQEGYFLADRLPLTFFSDQIVDSRELDASTALKYTWTRNFGGARSNLKAGVQWKANGNVGDGEYYEDPSLAANGYRPRPYSQYPFMHNISVYAEETMSVPVGRTRLELTAGLRMEDVIVRGSRYDGTNTLSPRFNARWKLSDHFAVRGGWGVTEKLPSFYILYPKQEYRDIRTFAFSHGDGGTSSYVYYTQPYAVEFNPELRWQRNRNSEVGVDAGFSGFKIALVGFRNVTSLPYKLSNRYTPFAYNILSVPSGFAMPADPMIRVDSQTGLAYIRGGAQDWWTPMDVKVQDRTFVRSTFQDNGSDVVRAGVELTVDFPEIKPLRTSLRLDASYAYSRYQDSSDGWYYNNGWSHTSLPNRSYQYVGIYPNGGSSTLMVSGKVTHSANANLTSITHIPEARLVVTCRLEVSVLTRSRNLPTGSTDVLYPSAYLDSDGVRHAFTQADASVAEFAPLTLYPANDYLFDQDGYAPYASANLSITKEVGDHVSVSFFANNFTNARPTVYSMATGVGAIFTPDFYYGLTCRLKF